MALFNLTVKEQAIDFRVSTCPMIHGEKIVIRILDANVISLKIEDLGLDQQQYLHFLEALAKPHDLILVTGPTGSGKTVTLYSALNALNHVKRNILTAEDPVEIRLPGINQTTINPKIGLTFASALRTFLRQDPDIIMIGEIRDFETADIAIKAAQTGHLVLSTLHTNSAVETLARLTNLGISSFNIATSFSLLVAQRLVRKLCDFCKIPYLMQLNDNSTWRIYKAGSCSHCIDGYRNRLSLFEIIPSTPASWNKLPREQALWKLLKWLRHNAIGPFINPELKK